MQADTALAIQERDKTGTTAARVKALLHVGHTDRPCPIQNEQQFHAVMYVS